MLAVLQDWIELEGSGLTGDFYQSGSTWLDLTGHQDIIFYLDVKYTPSGGQLRMNYETTPANEPASFTKMVSDFQMLGGSTVTPVFLSANPTVPLSGLVRWHIAWTGGSNFTVTFRIHCLAKKR